MRRFPGGHASHFSERSHTGDDVGNLRCGGGGCIAQIVYLVRERHHVRLSHFEGCAPLGHHRPRLIRRDVEGHAHLGRLFRKGYELFPGDAGLAASSNNLPESIRRHRDIFRELKYISAHLLELLWCVEVHHLAHVCHGGFKLYGGLHRLSKCSGKSLYIVVHDIPVCESGAEHIHGGIFPCKKAFLILLHNCGIECFLINDSRSESFLQLLCFLSQFVHVFPQFIHFPARFGKTGRKGRIHRRRQHKSKGKFLARHVSSLQILSIPDIIKLRKDDSLCGFLLFLAFWLYTAH